MLRFKCNIYSYNKRTAIKAFQNLLPEFHRIMYAKTPGVYQNEGGDWHGSERAENVFNTGAFAGGRAVQGLGDPGGGRGAKKAAKGPDEYTASQEDQRGIS